jgi:hypothetical protein
MDDPIAHQPILHLLEPGERIDLLLYANGNELRVTDRRLVVTEEDHVRLHVAYDELRRVQFDLEAMRPAVLVMVPHSASLEPQMLSIPRDQLHHAAEVLAFIGERLP